MGIKKLKFKILDMEPFTISAKMEDGSVTKLKNVCSPIGNLNIREITKLDMKFSKDDIVHINAIAKLGAKVGDCRNPNMHYFVALIDKKPIGYFWGQIGDGQYPISDREIYLYYITSLDEDMGIGRAMVNYIFQMLNIDTIVGECIDENYGFWEHLGAVLPSEYSCDIREVYDLRLEKKVFYGEINTPDGEV